MSKSIKELLEEVNLELDISSEYSYEFHSELIKNQGSSSIMLNKFKSMLNQTNDPAKQRILKDMISKEEVRLKKEQEDSAKKATEEKASKEKTLAEQAEDREKLKNTRILSSPQEWEEQKAMESLVEDPSMASEVAAQRRQNTKDWFKQKYPKVFADKENRKKALQDMEDRAAAEKEKSKSYDKAVEQHDPESRPAHATKKRSASRIIQMGERKGAMERKFINREQGADPKPELKNKIDAEQISAIKDTVGKPKKSVTSTSADYDKFKTPSPEDRIVSQIKSGSPQEKIAALKAARQKLMGSSSQPGPSAPQITPEVKKSSDNFDSLVDKLNNLKKGMANSGLGGFGSVKAGAVLPNKISIPKSSNNSAASKVKIPNVAPQSKKDPMRSIAQTQNKDIKDLKMKEANAHFDNQVIKYDTNGQWNLEKRCWEGYEPVPGKKAYSEDSCRPVKKKKSKNKSRSSKVDDRK